MFALVHTRHAGTESNLVHASYACGLTPCLSWVSTKEIADGRNACRAPDAFASSRPHWPAQVFRILIPEFALPRRIVLHPKRRSGMKNTFRVSPPKLSFVVTRLFQQPQSRYDYACQSVATRCRRRIWNAVDGHGSALPFQCLCAGSTGKAGSSWNSVPCSTKAVEEHSLRYGVLCRCGRKYHWKYRFRPWQNRSSFDAKYPC
jgi:hypothetical protein